MARMTREENRQRALKQIRQDVEINKTFPLRALNVLATAETLGLDYSVTFNADKTAVIVTVKATEDDLGYREDSAVQVWFEPSETAYTNPWNFTDLESLIERVETHKVEKQRLADVKTQALSKLTDEEKRVLGLLPNNRESFR